MGRDFIVRGAMRAQLVPADNGPSIELVKDLSLVGRKEDCDVRLDHKSISKQHCVIVKTDGLLLLRDLGSTNGTRDNDSDGEIPAQPVKNNQLPDVYPDDASPAKR